MKKLSNFSHFHFNSSSNLLKILNLLYSLSFNEFDEKVYFFQTKKLYRLFKKELYQIDSSLDTNYICATFIHKFKKIIPVIKSDLLAFKESDPALNSQEELIKTYPGLFAIFVYRVSHIFYQLRVPIFPRLLNEFAHSKTGIDIHPGASIGSNFFIDHGTGVVIGETSTIGNFVKMYHGVTLGALSLTKGASLKDQKRHPTIGNNVIIYANATILGGDTIIGDNSIIGSHAFIIESVNNNSIVRSSLDSFIIPKNN